MVMKIENIEKDVEKGRFEEAYAGLEEILSIGPKNTKALKMKALLLALEGKFSEEAQIWRKVISVDAEDEDALEYFQRTVNEQREHEFFSDILLSGGIRFIANPRSVVTTSFIGLMGCAIFLSIMNFAHRFVFLTKPLITYSSFLIFVMLPWFMILYVYFRALRDITIDRDAIHLRTRTSDFSLQWKDISEFYLVRSQNNGLFILLISKLSDKPSVLINIGGYTPVRAPSFLVREITRVFRDPLYETLESFKFTKKPKLFS